MKHFYLFLLFCISSSVSFSQHMLWGTVSNGGAYGFGFLYSTDSAGQHLQVRHHFDNTNDGRSPGPLMQASNGRLYGMALSGGPGVVSLPGGPSGTYNSQGGTLYEYDPVIDSFRVLVAFNVTDPMYPPGFQGPSGMKIFEASPGVLWCVMTTLAVNAGAPPRYIFSYNTATGARASVLSIPSWSIPSTSSPQYTGFSGTLVKGSDGYIYGTTYGYSACATLTDAQIGSIVRIDPATHAFSFIYPFSCSVVEGYIPEGNLEEVGGKFYSHTDQGGSYVYYPFYGHGVIYRYDPATNTYTREYNLSGGLNGTRPYGYILEGDDGMLYGTAYGGSSSSGILYQYDPAANAYTKKQDFVFTGSAWEVGDGGSLSVKAVNGRFYGTNHLGIFEYDAAANTLKPEARFADAAYNAAASPLIEICRAPAYSYPSQTHYTICEGSFFRYATNCHNAQSFVWLHNGLPAAGHTSGVLSFSAISAADAGTWSCSMTNSCGTTVTAAITLTVNPAGTGVITSAITAGGATTICPGSSVTLSGNNAGVWNTGATAAAITVTSPGAYQVTNSNACGTTYSNIINVDTIPDPVRQVASFTVSGGYAYGPVQLAYFCPGDSVELTGNNNGTWNTGEASYSIYVHDLLPHYIISSNSCTTVYSDTAQAAYAPVSMHPAITPSGSVHICAGDSLLIHGGPGSYNFYRNGSFVNYGTQLYAHYSGDYYIATFTSCGTICSDTVHLDADSTALGVATITASGPLTFCAGESVTLQSNYSNCSWNTGAVTSSVVVTASGTYQVTNDNGCSTATSAPVTVNVIAPPSVSYTEPNDSVCPATAAYMLAAGTPPGGTYSGDGVSGNTFSPAIAGSGVHVITYSWEDSITGCTGHSAYPVFVDGRPAIASATGSDTICDGSNAVLYQTVLPFGVWNTGQTGLYIAPTDAGLYYVTRLNVCGDSVHSDSITLFVIPLPPLPVVTQHGDTLVSSASTAGYQWYYNGSVITGATSQSYVPTQDGAYTVLTHGSNGCAVLSDPYAYMATGMAVLNPENGQINVYPNPGPGNLTLTLPPGDVQLRVINALGELVYAKEVKNERTWAFRLQQHGIYFAEITTVNGRYTRKIIVQ